MSLTALYVFTATEFTVSGTARIDHLQMSPSSYGAAARSSVVPRQVSGSVRLEPGVYRAGAGVSIAPGANAVAANLPASGVAAPGTAATRITGYAISRIPSTKSGWPDPPAIHASAALGIPIAELGPFLNDTGESSTIGEPSKASAK